MEIDEYKARFKKLTIEQQNRAIANMEKTGHDDYGETEYYTAFLALLTWCKLNKRK